MLSDIDKHVYVDGVSCVSRHMVPHVALYVEAQEQSRTIRGDSAKSFDILKLGLALTFILPFFTTNLPRKVSAAPLQVFKNEFARTEPDGRRVLVMRWAIGVRDNVQELTIPFEYVEFAGGCAGFSLDAPDPNCQQPYAQVTAVLKALLPDLRPKPLGKLPDADVPRVVHMMAYSLFDGARYHTAGEMLRGRAMVDVLSVLGGAYASLHVKPGDPLPLTYKEPLYGLVHLGLQHDLSPDRAILLHDYLYAPIDSASPPPLAGCEKVAPLEELRSLNEENVCRGWTETDTTIVCTDGAVPTRGADPRYRYVPSCDMEFAIEELSAVVQVSFERQYLGNWRAIKDQTSTFFSSLRKKR